MRARPAPLALLLIASSACVDPGAVKVGHDSADSGGLPRETGQSAGEGEGETGGDPSEDSATDTGEEPAPAEALRQLNGLEIRNIILVHADTLRADHLPMYGYDRLTSPNLMRDDGLVVSGYEVVAPWTLPSTSSAMFGLTSEHHGNVRVSGGVGAALATSLQEQLQANGFATAAFSGSRVIASDPILSEGFDVALEIDDLDDLESQSMSALWGEAQEWLGTLDEDQPFFLWLQPMDTHPPYRPRAPFRGTWADYDDVPMNIADGSHEQETSFIAAYEAATTDADRAAVARAVKDVYDELILQEDDGIGDLFTWLEDSGHAEDTLVVLTSDHGETIADDDQPTLSHMVSLRPELLRVPLVLYNPGLTDEVQVCRSSNIDLAPTLLRLVGAPAIDGIDGQALQDGCRDMTLASLYVNETDHDLLWWLSATDGIYKMDWNCLEGTASLYDLRTDPATLSPIAFDERDDAAIYWDALSDYLAEAVRLNPALTCDLSGVTPPPRSP